MEETFFKRQVIPVGLTVIVCGVLIVVLLGEIFLLNYFTINDISLEIRWIDVMIGLTIYLKTAIDFAIYIGHLMRENPGWKHRVAIEIGTAFGNALGTLAILLVWTFFKEVRFLLAFMIFLAALVLFRLAEDSLEHAKGEDAKYSLWFRKTVFVFEHFLKRVNQLIAPILRPIVPNLSLKSKKATSFGALFVFSFTVPFILGLDDFAGYVPLFSVINVFGFAIGVFLGHMVLNMFLYISPKHTIQVVKNPVIALLGSAAFVGLGIWGLVEVGKLIGIGH